MPQVTLAYPYEGHQPDETIEVDATTAHTLIRDGIARRPMAVTDSPTEPAADEQQGPQEDTL